MPSPPPSLAFAIRPGKAPVASAAGIYGNRGDELLDETSPAGSGFLADLCQQWEAAAQPAIDAGIRVLHLRFGVVLGPGPRKRPRETPPHLPPWPRRPARQRPSVHELDLAPRRRRRHLLPPRFSQRSPGPFNFTSPNPVTNAQFTSILAAQLHRPAFFTVPAFALRFALGEMADEARPLQHSSLPRPTRRLRIPVHPRHPGPRPSRHPRPQLRTSHPASPSRRTCCTS